jgi:hypothetical protein
MGPNVLLFIYSEGKYLEERIIGDQHYVIASPGCEYKIQVQVSRDPITNCFPGDNLGIRL